MVDPPLSWGLLLASMSMVAAAGVVRGFSGFGFSALSVAGLALLVSPARVVPAIFVLEVLASVSLLRGIARDIDWPWLSWLAIGNALFIPVGIVALAWLPEEPLRLVIGGLLLVAAVLMRLRVSLGLHPTAWIRLGTGLVSGLVNGLAAIGGIAVALLLNMSQMAPVRMRATMIVLFLFTDLYALGWAGVLSTGVGARSGLLDAGTLSWVLWLTPPMLAGIWLGQRLFAVVSIVRFRQHVLTVLTLVSLLTVLRALQALIG
jgi:uncharacterized membrane protein YfcA